MAAGVEDAASEVGQQETDGLLHQSKDWSRSDTRRDCQPDKDVDPSYPASRGLIFSLGGDMADRRQEVAAQIVKALESQSGLDTLPAQVSMARILTGVFKKTGVKFKPLGHGRMRWTFDIVSPGEDLGIVLKLGSKQATARDIALTLAFPDDRAQIYAATEYGVVAERVGPRTRVFLTDEEYDAFIAERFQGRYIGVGLDDLGQIGDRIVMIGSSTRVVKKDAAVKGSASQQIRTA